MIRILLQRNFALFWLGGLISSAGDWVLLIALPYYTYTLTGSTLLTGAMFIANALPRLLVGAVAGVFVDRWDRKRTMIIGDLSRAVLLLFLVLVRSAHSIWIIYAVTLAESAITQFFNPAKSAFIASLVEEERLMTANTLDTFSMGITRLAGPPLGGALMVALGLSSLVLIDSASFLFSALMLVLVHSTATFTTESPAVPSDTARPIGKWAAVWSDWIDGLRVVREERPVGVMFAVAGLVMVGYGIITVLTVVFVRDVLHGSAIELGWITTAQGGGLLIGTLLVGRIGGAIRPSRLLAAGLAGCGLAFLFAFNSLIFSVSAAGIAVAGLMMASWMISERTLLQSLVKDRFRGRIFGAYSTTNAVLMLGGMALASGLGTSLGPLPLLSLASLTYIAAGTVAFVSLPHGQAVTAFAEPTAKADISLD